MNYIDIFKKGGKIKDKLFEAITHIFQIDNDTASKLYDNALKKYGSDNKIMEALATEIGNDQSQESVQKAMMNVFDYEPKENETSIFKCGGKMQQLAARFGKGGSIGCGCGGMKMQDGGLVYEEFDDSDDSQINTYNKRYATPRPIYKPINKMNSAEIQRPSQPLYIQGYSESQLMPKYQQENKLPVNRINPNRPQGENYITPPVNRVESIVLQDGGYVPLTNNQARDIYKAKVAESGDDYIGGEYRNQLRKAKAGLREQGLRGRDLRQTARNLVTGISQAQELDIPEIEDAEPITINEPILRFDQPAPRVDLIPEQPSLDELVTRTLRGEFGNGADRRNNLGDRYDEVMREVNRRMRPQRPSTQDINDKLSYWGKRVDPNGDQNFLVKRGIREPSAPAERDYSGWYRTPNYAKWLPEAKPAVARTIATPSRTDAMENAAEKYGVVLYDRRGCKIR